MRDITSEKAKGIRRCPSCGTIVSFEAKCPECGYVFDSVETSSAIRGLFEELRLIGPRDYARKKQVLESFPIPNSKKDILDFLIMLKPLASDHKDALVDTYYKKYIECVEKSRTFFVGDDDFKPFIDSLDEIKKVSKKGRVGRWFSRNKGWTVFISILLVFALIFSFSLIVEFIRIRQENKSSITISSMGSSNSKTVDVFKEMSVKDKTFSANGKINEYDYVDLGLSVKWATMNVGAKSIYEFGDYYAWGESKTKEQYYDITYFDYDKEHKNNYYLKYNEDTCLNELKDEDDVATQKWGTSWRMPTVKEVNELLNNCSFTFCSIEGVSGVCITSEINSKSIFIPIGGYKDKEMIDEELNGYIWTSSLDLEWIFREYAFALQISFMGEEIVSEDRYKGIPVRPVSP